MTIKIAQLTSEQLSDSGILEKIKAIANDIAIHNQMSSAWSLVKKIERQTRSLIDSSPEIYKQYQRIIAQLKFTAIPYLTDEQLLQLIQSHYLKALKKGIDVEQKTKDYLAVKSVFTWDQFRREVITRLKENQEKIDKKTVSQWLNDYDNQFGARKNSSLERTKFISKSSADIDEKEKRFLSSLLTFYDYIKISPPLPYLNVSEVSLKEYFKGLGVPLPEEEGKKKIKLPARQEKKKDQKKLEEITKKKEKEKEEQKKEKEIPEKKSKTNKEKPDFFSPWRKKISPYEKERELHPSLPKKEKIKTEPVKKSQPKQKPAPEPEPEAKPKTAKIPPHEIRTMKEDIEKAKKRPIPEAPKPKTRKDNVIDLSDKE